MTNREIENRANELLEKYVKRGGVHKVWDAVMAGENIKYRQISTANSAFLGALTSGNNGQRYIMTSSAIDNDGRRNFTIAHELGHYALGHLSLGGSLYCGNDSIIEEEDASPDIERAANCFATCLLMPEGKVKSAFLGILRNSQKAKRKDRLDVTNNYTFGVWCGIRDDLTKRYGVSEEALRYRLKSLGLVSFSFIR